jgi:hypothetical protein
MYTYMCCQCIRCEAQIVLEDRADTNLLHKPPRPRPGREACPYCRAVFVPQSYYVRWSPEPEVGVQLLSGAPFLIFRPLKDHVEGLSVSRIDTCGIHFAVQKYDPEQSPLFRRWLPKVKKTCLIRES